MDVLTLALTLAVRLYDIGALTDADRSAVIAVASETLMAAGIPTSWPECPAPRPLPLSSGVAVPAAFTCDRPLGPAEVAVRLLRNSTSIPAHRALPLGDSLIDRTGGNAALATIYLDRLTWVADDADTPRPLLLGRAIAHEIGHLLLGSNTHARQGLMRALWSRQTLERGRASDWLFTPGEGAAMRQALDRRTPVLLIAGDIGD